MFAVRIACSAFIVVTVGVSSGVEEEAVSALSAELEPGVWAPLLALGTADRLHSDPAATYQACLQFLRLGGRHIDTASQYRNHDGVARAIADSGIQREDLFLTTKVYLDEMGYEATFQAVPRFLQELRTDYIDLLLLHKPGHPEQWDRRKMGEEPPCVRPAPISSSFGVESSMSPPDWRLCRLGSWAAMEQSKRLGLVRAIGVSNYEIPHLEELRVVALEPIAAVQLEFHPLWFHKELLDYCKTHRMSLFAFGSLGSRRGVQALSSSAELQALAGRELTVPEMFIRWALGHGVGVIFSSTNPKHMYQNLKQSRAPELSPATRNALDSFGMQQRSYGDPRRIIVHNPFPKMRLPPKSTPPKAIMMGDSIDEIRIKTIEVAQQAVVDGGEYFNLVWARSPGVLRTIRSALADGNAVRLHNVLPTKQAQVVQQMFARTEWGQLAMPTDDLAAKVHAMWEELSAQQIDQCLIAKEVTSVAFGGADTDGTGAVAVRRLKAVTSEVFDDFLRFVKSPEFRSVLDSFLPDGRHLGVFRSGTPIVLRPGDFLGYHSENDLGLNLAFYFGGSSSKPRGGRVVFCEKSDDRLWGAYTPAHNDLLIFEGNASLYHFVEPVDQSSSDYRLSFLVKFRWAESPNPLASQLGSIAGATADKRNGAHGRTLFLSMCMGATYFNFFCAPFLASYKNAYKDAPFGAHSMRVWTLGVSDEDVEKAVGIFGNAGVTFHVSSLADESKSWMEEHGSGNDSWLAEDYVGNQELCYVPSMSRKSSNDIMNITCKSDTHDERVKFNNRRFLSWVDDQLSATKDEGFEYIALIDSDTLFVRSLDQFLPARSDARANDKKASWDVAFTYYDREHAVPWGSNYDVARTRGGHVRLNSGVQLLSHNRMARAWLRAVNDASAELQEKAQLDGEQGNVAASVLDDFRAPNQAALAVLIGIKRLSYDNCSVCDGIPFKVPFMDARVIGFPARLLNQMESLPDGRLPAETHIVHLKGMWWRVLVLRNLALKDTHRKYDWNKDAYRLWATNYNEWFPGTMEQDVLYMDSKMQTTKKATVTFERSDAAA